VWALEAQPGGLTAIVLGLEATNLLDESRQQYCASCRIPSPPNRGLYGNWYRQECAVMAMMFAAAKMRDYTRSRS
jgi:hypothetical protein